MNCNGLKLLHRITMGLTIALSSPSTFGQEEIWKVRGDQLNQGLGNILDSVGDLTGDGIPEIVACGSGLARVLSGVDGSTVYSNYGTNPTDGFGGSLAVLGDVDGDGVSDFAVGASGVDNSLTNQGAVFVYSGQAGALIYSVYGSSAGDALGWALAALGDVNADGIGDFAVGSIADYALVLSGVDGSLIWTLTSPTKPLFFGRSLGGGGDVDADGVPDVVVGDIYSWYGIKDGGAACVFSGATGALLHEFGSTEIDAYFGYSVTIPGDVDLDGFADVLIGAPADDRLLVGGGGYAAVYSGKDGSILMSFLPYDTNYARSWSIGVCVGGAGDTNDDGYPDLLIGAPSFSADYVLGTSTFLFSGRDGGLLYHFHPDGPSSGGGNALARAGDLDGDGLPDFAFGAWFEDNGSLQYAGSVSTWRGHKFFVDTLPHNAHSFDPVTMMIGQGVAGNFYALFLRSLNGTPTFALLSLGALDAAGRSSLSTTIPPGLGFISLDLQALTLDANGKLVPSNVETFTTQ